MSAIIAIPYDAGIIVGADRLYTVTDSSGNEVARYFADKLLIDTVGNLLAYASQNLPLDFMRHFTPIPTEIAPINTAMSAFLQSNRQTQIELLIVPAGIGRKCFTWMSASAAQEQTNGAAIGASSTIRILKEAHRTNAVTRVHDYLLAAKGKSVDWDARGPQIIDCTDIGNRTITVQER